MRRYIILVILLATSYLYSQSFEYNPENDLTTLHMTMGGQVVFREISQSKAPAGPNLTFKNEEGSDFLKISEANGIEYNLFESKMRTTLNTNGLQLFRVSESNTNPELTFDFSPEAGLRAYNSSGQTTVQIRGNVSGEGRVSTNELEITGGSDLSEYFSVNSTSSDKLPGMLVSISDHSNDMEITASAYDKKVVGVISGANGIETGLMMGQKGSIADGDTPIALVGRTYVYVTTENGPIEKGDFLTSSSKKGYAMKVKKHKKARGAIIGKALTSLESGEGFVLVLVNLQ